MKFKEYVKILSKYLNSHPEYADLDVIYGADAEGNGFDYVEIIEPEVGNIDDYDFIPLNMFEDYEHQEEKINSICIN